MPATVPASPFYRLYGLIAFCRDVYNSIDFYTKFCID